MLFSSNVVGEISSFLSLTFHLIYKCFVVGDPEAIQTAQYLLQQSVREHSSGFVGY